MHDRGRKAEFVALSFLQLQGLTLVKQNWRASFGEVDLIMRQTSVLVFVEVKFRSRGEFESPLQAVTKRKQDKLRRLASAFVAAANWQGDCRFDVVAIDRDCLQWVKGAF